mmetsp:Transcript_33335/g.68031  ORF Transcript_33335/g.68031 Transcript_33335/m.68031 type:complete len:84 (-) Transcript_33335:536-787(-)
MVPQVQQAWTPLCMNSLGTTSERFLCRGCSNGKIFRFSQHILTMPIPFQCVLHERRGGGYHTRVFTTCIFLPFFTAKGDVGGA